MISRFTKVSSTLFTNVQSPSGCDKTLVVPALLPSQKAGNYLGGNVLANVQSLTTKRSQELAQPFSFLFVRNLSLTYLLDLGALGELRDQGFDRSIANQLLGLADLRHEAPR